MIFREIDKQMRQLPVALKKTEDGLTVFAKTVEVFLRIYIASRQPWIGTPSRHGLVLGRDRDGYPDIAFCVFLASGTLSTKQLRRRFVCPVQRQYQARKVWVESPVDGGQPVNLSLPSRPCCSRWFPTALSFAFLH